MNFKEYQQFRTIKNSIPQTPEQQLENIILNSIDRGVGAISISLSSSTQQSLKDLTDLILVNRTVANARRAFEIDPTVRSSILSMLIIANGDWEIEGDKDASEAAIKHIKNKSKEWDLNQIINGILMKDMVDGKCFLRKKAFTNDITNVDFLAYDENTYNFIELKDDITGKLYGYKQKAKVYTVPSTWKTDSFDTLANRTGEDKETNFMPGEVIYPKLFEDGSSLVYGALDEVYCIKLIKNMMPTIVKRAAMTLGVEVGNKDAPYKPYDEADDYDTKKAKVDAGLQKFGQDFAKKEEKDTITHSFGERPYMIGDGRLLAVNPFLEFFKQEAKEAMLTPDSRFNSASTNKSTAGEQLGDKGQMTVIGFLQDNVNQYIQPYLFDDQLSKAKYTDDIGKIYIKFTPLKVEDDLTLAQVGEKLETLYPSPDEDDKALRMQTYFPKYYNARQNYLADLENTDENNKQIVNSIVPTNYGFLEGQEGTMDLINSWKKVLIEEEIVKEP